MSNLQVINIDKCELWDSIVKSFSDYDVCYLNGYAKAFQLHDEGVPLLFYYDDIRTKAINVVMKRDIAMSASFKDKIPINTWFDLATPYGYGGFWIKGERSKAVEEAYISYCREEGFVSEFVRFHLFSGYQQYFAGICETRTHNIVRSLELPLDEILMNFEHKVRKNLKKANKAGLEVEIDTTGKRLKEFLEIYYGTMDRNNANSNFLFSEGFYKTINNLKNNYLYIHILYEGKVISTELVLYGNENCYSFLGGTKRDYFNLRPNDFLKYQIIKWAKEKGLKRFILGGGYGKDDGIFKYKKSFAPNGIVDFYIGKRILDEEKHEELVKIRRQDQNFEEKTSFFPAYRG